MTKRRLVITILLLAMLLAMGCSRTTVFYSKLDWLAYRWVDGLLDADNAQAADWEARIAVLLETHRRELLPGVVNWLDAASIQARDGMTRPGLECLSGSARELMAAHARLAVPVATEILVGTGPRQHRHLGEALTERNAAYREDYLAPDAQEREADRLARYIKRLERWTGSLSGAQRALVEREVAGMPDLAEGWLLYRERQQRRLLQQLADGADGPVLNAFLTRWWVEQADRGDALASDFELSVQRGISLLLALDQTLDEDQRARLHRELRSMRDDLAAFLPGAAVSPQPGAQLPAGCLTPSPRSDSSRHS